MNSPPLVRARGTPRRPESGFSLHLRESARRRCREAVARLSPHFPHISRLCFLIVRWYVRRWRRHGLPNPRPRRGDDRGKAAPARRSAAACAPRLPASARERDGRGRAPPRRALVRRSEWRLRCAADAGLTPAADPRRSHRDRRLRLFDPGGARRARPRAIPRLAGRGRRS